MKKRILKSIKNYNIKKLFQDFVKTLAVYLVATGCALALNAAAVMNDNIFGVYMLAVAIISVTTESYIWGVLASVGGVIGVNFFFTYGVKNRCIAEMEHEQQRTQQHQHQFQRQQCSAHQRSG